MASWSSPSSTRRARYCSIRELFQSFNSASFSSTDLVLQPTAQTARIPAMTNNFFISNSFITYKYNQLSAKNTLPTGRV